MTTKDEQRTKNGQKVKLTIMDANEQMRRMQKAVAHRAYAVFGISYYLLALVRSGSGGG